MDSLVLIERLDELMAEAKPVPLTREARVDRDEVYKILDRLRTTLPVEFERVRWAGKEAEQEQALEAKLGEINEAIGELRRAQSAEADDRPTEGPPLTRAASEQVREILEAAERTAAAVEREATAEAKGVREEANAHLRRAREEAERHVSEARERADAEAADYLRRVEEATKQMLERASTAGTELDGMLARLRGSGGSVIEELEAMMSGLSEIEVRRAKPAGAGGPQPAPSGTAGAQVASRAPPAGPGNPTTVARMPAGPRRAAASPQQLGARVQRPVAPTDGDFRRPASRPSPHARPVAPVLQPTAAPAPGARERKHEGSSPASEPPPAEAPASEPSAVEPARRSAPPAA